MRLFEPPRLIFYKIFYCFTIGLLSALFTFLANDPYALQKRLCTENSKQIFLEMKLRGLSPSSYIHGSVSDLYIRTIVLPILQQENRMTDRWE